MLWLITLLSVPHTTNGLNRSYIPPQGCSYDSRLDLWSCLFDQWIPPLKDEDFDPGPLQHLSLTNINGQIPGGAFSGLNGPTLKKGTYIYLRCTAGNILLSRDVFTENLQWVLELRIYDCYLKNGLPSRLLENLKDLGLLLINGRGIEGLVAHDCLAGLTNLQSITFQVPVETGLLPPCLFDGLRNLTLIRLMSTNLNVIPPNWFDGLVNLERISLADNELQTLPPGLFNGLPSLTDIEVHANPWNCSCGLMWLLDWSNITNLVLCKDPVNFEGLKLEEAFGLLDCTSATPLSTSTRTTGMQTSFGATFAGTMVSRLDTSSQRACIASMQTSTDPSVVTSTSAMSASTDPSVIALTSTSAMSTSTDPSVVALTSTSAMSTSTDLSVVALTSTSAMSTSANSSVVALTSTSAMSISANSSVVALTSTSAMSTSTDPSVVALTSTSAMSTSTDPVLVALTSTSAMSASGNSPVMALTSTASPVTLPNNSTPRITAAISSVIVTLKTMLVSKASGTLSATLNEIWTDETVLNLTSRLSAGSTIAQTSYSTSTTTRGSGNQTTKSQNSNTATDIRSTALLSSAGGLAVLSVGTAVLYRRVCRKKLVGNANSMDNGGEDR